MNRSRGRDASPIDLQSAHSDIRVAPGAARPGSIAGSAYFSAENAVGARNWLTILPTI